jgi:hypothetical protein
MLKEEEDEEEKKKIGRRCHMISVFLWIAYFNQHLL